MNRAIEIVLEKFDRWGESLVEMLPNLAVALLVIVVAIVAAQFGRKLATRGAARLDVPPAMRRLLGVLLSIGISSVGLFIALGVLQLDKTVTSLLAGAGVLGLAVGFAAQAMVGNLISGVLISLRRPIREGELVEVVGHFGVVEKIDLRVTELGTPEGQIVLIPNREILNQPVVNYSRLGRRRVDLEVGVSYGDDLEKAKALALATVEDLAAPELGPPELFYREFGSSSINFVVRFWLRFERQSQYLEARSRAIMGIKRAFDENGITIPFPIRTLDFDDQTRAALGGLAG